MTPDPTSQDIDWGSRSSTRSCGYLLCIPHVEFGLEVVISICEIVLSSEMTPDHSGHMQVHEDQALYEVRSVRNAITRCVIKCEKIDFRRILAEIIVIKSTIQLGPRGPSASFFSNPHENRTSL